MEDIQLTSWYGKYPIIYKVYISQVVQDFFHQQYEGDQFQGVSF